MTSLVMTRWLLVALSAVLAVVLISRGNVLIGGLIGAMAVIRVVSITQMQRRRERMRRRFESAGRGRRWQRPDAPQG